jgi:spore coat polysaccharide biosynthesis protein SpsF
MRRDIAIVQARMGSSRLPGKIMKNLCGKPVLWHVCNRLSYSEKIEEIVIATTKNKEDLIVEKFCKENNISYFRGSEKDVLLRYYEAAKLFNAEVVIRVTSDCPIIDPQIVDKMIEEFLLMNSSEICIDYLSNSLMRTFPRGLDVEIFTYQALEKANFGARKEYEREHVTPYIYQHPQIFSIRNFENQIDYSFHRWTLDTEEDYKLIKKIYEFLYSDNSLFFLHDVLNLFEKKPELKEINKHIKQKEF